MSNESGRLFWLTLQGHAAGPFSAAQIHEKLASGEIQWQTPACEVGEHHWTPIVDHPHLGPPRRPRDEAIRPQPPMVPRSVESVGLPGPTGEQMGRDYPALRQVFLGLLAADIVTSIASLGLGFVGLAMEPVNEFAVNNGPSPADGLLCIGTVILLPAIIAAWVGMWRLWNWGRWLFLGCAGAGHLFGLGTSLFDFSAQWQFPTAVGSVESTISGLLLAIAFFSPLASIFRASSTRSATTSSNRQSRDRAYA